MTSRPFKINIMKENEINVLQIAKIVVHKEILSFKEAIFYLDVSESFLYKLTSKKSIPFTKPNGGKIYFLKKDLDKWMLQNMSITMEQKEEEILDYLRKNSKNGKQK